MPTNTETLSAKTATLSVENACCVESCYVAAAATYMPAGLGTLDNHRCCSSIRSGGVLLQDGYLLDRCHSVSMPVELLSFMLHLCWLCASLAAILACMVSHYQPCLLVWCLTIGHACSCGASLYIMPFGVVPHNQPCLEAWCLTIGLVFWCGASLLAMPSGVVANYRPCLLV